MCCLSWKCTQLHQASPVIDPLFMRSQDNRVFPLHVIISVKFVLKFFSQKIGIQNNYPSFVAVYHFIEHLNFIHFTFHIFTFFSHFIENSTCIHFTFHFTFPIFAFHFFLSLYTSLHISHFTFSLTLWNIYSIVLARNMSFTNYNLTFVCFVLHRLPF